MIRRFEAKVRTTGAFKLFAGQNDIAPFTRDGELIVTAEQDRADLIPAPQIKYPVHLRLKTFAYVKAW